MRERFLMLGSGAAAFGASLCCLGPLVLGSMGLGAALVSTFAPLRPYFLALSGGLLALGFYFVYRKPKSSQVCEGEVCGPESRTHRWAKPILWIATAMVAALALFPTYGAKLVGTPAVATPAPATKLETVQLSISGMTCEACAGVVKYTLLDTPGVTEAEVDFAGGRAVVKYDGAQTEPAKLLAAVNATGYTAELAPAQ